MAKPFKSCLTCFKMRQLENPESAKFRASLSSTEIGNVVQEPKPQNWVCLVGKLLKGRVWLFSTIREPPNVHITQNPEHGRELMFYVTVFYTYIHIYIYIYPRLLPSRVPVGPGAPHEIKHMREAWEAPLQSYSEYFRKHVGALYCCALFR